MSNNKDPTLLDLVLCPLCHFLMSSPSRNPMILIKCGHTVCSSCLSKIYCCPICYNKSIDAQKNISVSNLLEFAYKSITIPPKLNPLDISALSNENSDSFEGQPSENGPICTYSKYPNTYLIQNFYHCKECKLVGDLGCCEACAKRCHPGHHVYPDPNNYRISTICNCGAHTLESVKCHSCYHKHEVCTHVKNGDAFIQQDFYACLTCRIADDYGICGPCARNCHYGHDLIYKGKVQAFCDCQILSHNCICQT
ncbi:hypothetical protein M9Y10_021634 [Tritrichomonas musculus]|uniref:Uncharacterized protein n=1 Tax=Tritrichomonas musculus TaxID=1915356 RepID=A0ABR2KQD1_9EUKA